MPVEFRPLHGSFGAEVIGADPALEVDDPTFAAIEAAWYRHSILLFRGLTMTPEQQVAFTRRFGPLHIMVPRDWNLPDHPEVWVVGNAEQDGKAIGLRGAGMGFHSDGEDKPVPNAGSFLYAQTGAARGRRHAVRRHVRGARRAAAGDPPQNRRTARALQPQRAAPSELSAPAAGAGTSGAAGRVPPARTASSEERPRVALYRPLGLRHRGTAGAGGPRAGERGCRNSQRSRALSIATAGVAGDAILWDNRCTQHSATGFDESRYARLMHRTTLEGDAPVMAEPAAAA